MFVTFKNKKIKFDSSSTYPILQKTDEILFVHATDNEHYYVRINGVINGLDKGYFNITSKKEERKLKFNRLLNPKTDFYTNEINIEVVDSSTMEIGTNWSGEYPNLCSGVWTIYLTGYGYKMLLPIPSKYRGSSMGTSGTYSSWSFDENYSEEFEDYYDDGNWNHKTWLEYSLWCLEEAYNIKFKDIPLLCDLIYNTIQENDWRGGSCGGCI